MYQLKQRVLGLVFALWRGVVEDHEDTLLHLGVEEAVPRVLHKQLLQCDDKQCQHNSPYHTEHFYVSKVTSFFGEIPNMFLDFFY